MLSTPQLAPASVPADRYLPGPEIPPRLPMKPPPPAIHSPSTIPSSARRRSSAISSSSDTQQSSSARRASATATASHGRAAANEQAAMPRKKRSRPSSSPEGDDADRSKRGRPRVDRSAESAESAADRRRTQIRMAQRAYRQRKESTLEELRIKVADLSDVLLRMNKTFTSCRDLLSTSGLSQPQLVQLQEASAEFEGLVKTVGAAGSNSDSPPSPPSKAMSNQYPAKHVAPLPSEPLEYLQQPRNVASWLDPTAIAESNRPRVQADLGLGYNMYPGGDHVNGHDQHHHPSMNGFYDQHVAHVSGVSGHDGLIAPLELPMNGDRHHYPEAKLLQQLSPPRSLSSHETTFGRWLHRSCIESGYQLLLHHRVRPATYARVFRLSIVARNHDKILAGLRSLLDRDPCEDLNFWQAPLIHVGGAGTHYPRRDHNGNLLPMKKTCHVGLIGPQALATLGDAELAVDMTVDVKGCEGEWFDPYDVQGYIEDKGIILEPTNRYVPAEIWEWPGAIPTTAASATTGPSEAVPWTEEQLHALLVAGADADRWQEARMTLGGVGANPMIPWSSAFPPTPGDPHSSKNDTAFFNDPSVVMESLSAQMMLPAQQVVGLQYRPDPSAAPLSPSSEPRKRNVIIDLEKFIRVLTVVGVCLGRCPGFRRRDIDRALAMASYDV